MYNVIPILFKLLIQYMSVDGISSHSKLDMIMQYQYILLAFTIMHEFFKIITIETHINFFIYFLAEYQVMLCVHSCYYLWLFNDIHIYIHVCNSRDIYQQMAWVLCKLWDVRGQCLFCVLYSFSIYLCTYSWFALYVRTTKNVLFS